MRLLIFGLGYSGAAVARAARRAGWDVVATSRALERVAPIAVTQDGVRLVRFDAAGAEVAAATHVLATAPPRAGDPVLAQYGEMLRNAAGLAWIGYLSTTGVYGDRSGGWVDEETAPAPGSPRSVRRLEAELAWREVAAGRALDICRLAGIYGPGRNVLDDVRAGRERRVSAPGHAFGRIHVDDIVGGVMAAIARPPEGTRVLNFSDNEPAESADVVAEACRILGVEPPEPVPFDVAWAGMSEMARSFWAENRRVCSKRSQAMLAYAWRYPTYREGLRATEM